MLLNLFWDENFRLSHFFQQRVYILGTIVYCLLFKGLLLQQYNCFVTSGHAFKYSKGIVGEILIVDPISILHVNV